MCKGRTAGRPDDLPQRGAIFFQCHNGRIPQGNLNELLDIISALFFLICAKWNEYFCVEEIKFYC